MPDSDFLLIVKRPFKLLAKRLDIKEEDLLSNLKASKKKRVIRRFGAVLSHRKIGLKANALVAWKVKKKDIDSAGKAMAEFTQVSHCYLRTSYAKWPYNLYTMLHSDSREELLRIISRISKKVRPEGYRVLFTLKEFKKTGFTPPFLHSSVGIGQERAGITSR